MPLPETQVEPLERTYEIKEVAELTGLSASRLRAWERRYAVVRPPRQDNGYRAYTARQVALLRAFARLVQAGERIGDLVERPHDEVIAAAARQQPGGSPQSALLEAVKALDRERLEMLVAQQLSLHGLTGFAREVVLPLAQSVGDLWALGVIPIAGEHLASEVVVHALKGGLRVSRGTGPLVVAASLPNERHEWGFLCTLAVVHEDGWRVHYLGPDLPVQEVIEAAWRLRPACIALSASHPDIVRDVLPALVHLSERLPPGVIPVIGGSGVEGHERRLAEAGFRVGTDARVLIEAVAPEARQAQGGS